MTQIAEAASSQDIPAVQRLSKKAAELKDLKDQAAAIQQRLSKLSDEDSRKDPPTSNNGLSGSIRELPIRVTEGMIRQNLLTLSLHIKRGKIKLGEELTIEALPSGDRFRTILLDKGNKLRERGRIAQFYRDAHVKGGDYVVLNEVSPGRWTLKKAPPGQHAPDFAEF